MLDRGIPVILLLGLVERGGDCVVDPRTHDGGFWPERSR
jgi:hypothetical protein